MMHEVDFLPAAYRQRQAQRRATSDRLLLAIPIVVALTVVDLLLRTRVAGVREMAELATENADLGDRRSFAARLLARRSGELRAELEAMFVPLAAPRMLAVLDEALMARPAGVRFRELRFRLSPWSKEAEPEIQIDASCDDKAGFAAFLSALERGNGLPPLRCPPTELRQDSGELVFRITNASGRGGSK